MMPNVLQYPVAVAAVLRAGFIAVNVNPLYTARELEHQLEDSGAEAVIVLENFASTLEQALRARRQDRGQACRRGLDGRPAGISQGPDRELRGAHRAQDDAGLHAAGPCQVQRRDRGRPLDGLRAARPRARRRGGAAIYRRHHGRRQGRHAAASHDRGQPAGLRGVDAARPQAQAAHRPVHHRLRPAALSRLRLHHLRPARHAHRRAQHPHSQPARHEGHGQGARQVPHQHLSRR